MQLQTKLCPHRDMHQLNFSKRPAQNQFIFLFCRLKEIPALCPFKCSNKHQDPRGRLLTTLIAHQQPESSRIYSWLMKEPLGNWLRVTPQWVKLMDSIGFLYSVHKRGGRMFPTHFSWPIYCLTLGSPTSRPWDKTMGTAMLFQGWFQEVQKRE